MTDESALDPKQVPMEVFKREMEEGAGGRRSGRKKLKSIVLRHNSEYLVSLEAALLPSHIHLFSSHI